MLFSDLHLSAPILAAIKSQGYTTPTAIQAQAIPPALAGKDVLGSAQTGTGKTAAFAMPILHRLSSTPRAAVGGRGVHKPRCLVLSPTRELAVQIADSFSVYGKGLHLNHVTVYGGVGQYPQVAALRKGVDIIVATPGRLMDLMEQRHVDLSAIEVLVLDEADRMLDMGFIQPIRQIVARLPQGRQTLLFSATMPPEIRRLADSLLRNPAVVSIARSEATTKIEESVYRVNKSDKPELLAHLVKSLPMYRTIVFTRTKHGADRVVRHLHARGIRSEAIHGNKTQSARQRALAQFDGNKIPVLVATDIASRGIDVDGITHVVNYDLTHEPETYVHRIGRTARAGASGSAVSFCDGDEVKNLRAIERLTRRPIPVLPNPLPKGGATLEIHEAPRGERGADRERGSREGGGRDRAPRRHASDRPSREGPTRDHTRRDPSPREHAPRDHSSRGHSAKRSASHGPRDHAPRGYPTARGSRDAIPGGGVAHRPRSAAPAAAVEPAPRHPLAELADKSAAPAKSRIAHPLHPAARITQHRKGETGAAKAPRKSAKPQTQPSPTQPSPAQE